jgi:asparagine synthase (glutamine-hydrolysing)
MGGIAGIMSLSREPVDPIAVERMSQTLAHRGPDEEGFYLSADQTFALGTRRLAIVSPGERHQQLHANEMRDVWLGLDGEIYNHRALRHGLELDGHSFRGACDAEVAVHAYEQQGPKFLHHLQGMFALALWDDSRKRLLLARDRLGEKPLYYARHGKLLLFSSELRAILRVLPRGREFDARALSYFLTFGCVPAPFTLFAGIRKLAPGEALLAERDHGVGVHSWWAPLADARRAAVIRELPADRHRANLRTLIECSVADRLAGDQGATVWLSGGLAANCLAIMATRLGGRAIDAVAVAFPAAPECDEAEFARLTARRLNARLHLVCVDEEAALAELPALVAYMDEPLADPFAFVSWFAAQRCRGQGLPVAMSGLGADEILNGHAAYRSLRRLKPWWSMLRPLPPGLSTRLAPPLLMLGGIADAEAVIDRLARRQPLFLTAEALFSDAEKRGLVGKSWTASLAQWPADSALPSTSDRDSGTHPALADLRLRVPELLLAGQDRLAMAHGIEVRTPFLDHQFVDYALAIPQCRHTGREGQRPVLSEVLAGVIPEILARRTPKPRAVPLDRWFRAGLGAKLEQLLRCGRLVTDGLIDGDAGLAWLARHRGSAGPRHVGRLWALLVLAEWYESFMSPSQIRPAAHSARIVDAAE